jgi:hypothetical protein
MSKIFDKINQLRYNLLNKPHERGERDVYVTEIVAYYYPYKGVPIPDQLIRGDLYHFALQEMLKDYCNSEVSASKEYMGKLIKGRIDMVCGEYLVEIKSSPKTSFYQGSLQLQIYNWLRGGNNKLMLLYPTLTFDVIKPEPLEKIEEMVSNYLKARFFSDNKT